MVRFWRIGLAACPICHPPLRWSLAFMRHHGGNVLKYQEYCEELRGLPLNSMECGIHKPFIHICTYGVDRLTYALRDTTEKCFDCGFLPVRQHPQNDCLCRHTSCDDGHKITVTFFQRYLVETNHL